MADTKTERPSATDYRKIGPTTEERAAQLRAWFAGADDLALRVKPPRYGLDVRDIGGKVTPEQAARVLGLLTELTSEKP